MAEESSDVLSWCTEGMLGEDVLPEGHSHVPTPSQEWPWLGVFLGSLAFCAFLLFCQLAECIPRLWQAGGSHQSKSLSFAACALCVIPALGCHGAIPCSPGCTSSEWGVWEGHSMGSESFQGAAVTQDGLWGAG